MTKNKIGTHSHLHSEQSWPDLNVTPVYTNVQWCVRRLATVEECCDTSSRSLKHKSLYCAQGSFANLIPSKRKIVTILEDEQEQLTVRNLSKRADNDSAIKSSSRECTKKCSSHESSTSNQNLSRLSVIKKCDKDSKNYNKFKAVSKPSPTKVRSSRISSITNATPDSARTANSKPKDKNTTPKVSSSPAKSSVITNDIKLNNIINNKLATKDITPNITDTNVINKNTALENKTENLATKKNVPQKSPSRTKQLANVPCKVNTFLKKKKPPAPSVSSPVAMMSVTSISHDPPSPFQTTSKCYLPAQIITDNFHKRPLISTTATSTDNPKTHNQTTETNEINQTEMEVQTEDSQIDLCLANLCTPTLSLKKGNNVVGSIVLESHSLPNLQLPPFKISPRKKTSDEVDKQMSSSGSKSTSIIIGEATVTYTTKKKINFQVVGTTDDDFSPTSTVAPYPFGVMSMLKKEFEREKLNKRIKKQKTILKRNEEIYKWPEEGFSRDNYKERKLIKPSHIIRQMQDNEMIDSSYISEQFQKELSFIDSFFDSLNYLENSSMCEVTSKATVIQQDDGESQVVSRFHRGERNSVDEFNLTPDTRLSLLNLLLRDENRRAKNLLFVLKMREDALKDFTKSQILWLESKKRNDHIDVSVIKKKQRGALLKLQQECGEMQRMKKALLALSERRKTALIETKRNIETKLAKETPCVEKIIKNGKKKFRRPANKQKVFPLKCFDLSGSSYCGEDSVERDLKEIERSFSSDTTLSNVVLLNEKHGQTGESVTELLKPDDNVKAGNQLVKVDGGYLNILFHNLALPEIFSSGTEYEVNELALANILNSANRLQESLIRDRSNTLEKYLNQSKVGSVSKCSSPSTARSLVDEYLHYLNDNTMETNDSKNQQNVCHFKSIETDNSSSLEYAKDSSTSVESNELINHKDLDFKDAAVISEVELVPEVAKVNVIQSTWSLNTQDMRSGAFTCTDEDLYESAPLGVSSQTSESTTIPVKPYGSPVTTYGFPIIPFESPTMHIETLPMPPQIIVSKEPATPSGIAAMCSEATTMPTEPPIISPLSSAFTSESFGVIMMATEPSALHPRAPIQTAAPIMPSDAKMMPSKAPAMPTILPGNLAVPFESLAMSSGNIAIPSESLAISSGNIAMLSETPAVIPEAPATPAVPTLLEAELLRKKQLAIELEIKALEQQQSAMFMVREIPDKPPPPYTPPVAGDSAPAARPNAGFTTDKRKLANCVEAFCKRYNSDNEAHLQTAQMTDSFEEFLNDLCDDGMRKYMIQPSDEPWSASNLIPIKPSSSKENIQKRVQEEVLEILGCTPKPVMPGPEVLNKRSDYIDDILFTEWRKCEQEWTNLEADEIAVKNQVFESIFTKVLQESIDYYKTIVKCEVDGDSDHDVSTD